MERTLLILPEYLNSPPVFGWVHATQSLVLCVMFGRSLFVLLSFFIWSLCCLSFDLRILVTPLVSYGHCIVCPSIYGFWLPLWYLMVIVLSVLLCTDSGYPFGILWSLYCLSFDLRILVTSLVSSNS